jgi:hypothetical protein
MGPSSLVSLRVGENEIKVIFTEERSLREIEDFSFFSTDAYFFDARSGLRLGNRLRP